MLFDHVMLFSFVVIYLRNAQHVRVYLPMDSIPLTATSPSILRDSLDTTARGEYEGKSDNYITFLHPGYDDRSKQNVLLRIQAVDRENGGLHYGTALSACRIVAGNSDTGYFTLRRDSPKIELHFDELLRDKKYYFYNPDAEDDVYPIYRSFADWNFPHDNFPIDWSRMNGGNTNEDRAPPSASGLTAFINSRDRRCRVSEARGADYFTSAHLVPRSEKDWFETNGMEEYNLNQLLPRNWLVDDVRNAIALRSDVHLAFDDRKFVIVPKQSRWVVHFMGQTNSMGSEFHNTYIHLDGISSRFLYARFAWTVFHLLWPFLSAHVPRQLLVRLPNGQESSREFTSEELRSTFPSSRSRSASPKKRQITVVDEDMHTSKRVCRRDWSEAVRSEHTRSTSEGESVLPSTPQNHAKPASHVLKQKEWLRSQRPTDPSLYCCNYEAAEADALAGLPGKSEYGGRYLCARCLGVEYKEDRDRDVENVEATWD